MGHDGWEPDNSARVEEVAIKEATIELSNNMNASLSQRLERLLG